MIYLKTYQKYIINNFLATFGKIFFIFLSLAFVLTIFEEISFFKDIEISFFVPFFLTLLNVPSVLYEIFPFIFLISTQFFFIKLADRHELIAFKNFGLDNTKVLKLISFTTLLMGILVITIFYNVSANMKFLYLDMKNEYTKDNNEYMIFKFKLFTIGIIFLIISEISIRYAGLSNKNNLIFILVPVILFLILRQIFNNQLKFKK